jgi:hypothetical protein
MEFPEPGSGDATNVVVEELMISARADIHLLTELPCTRGTYPERWQFN